MNTMLNNRLNAFPGSGRSSLRVVAVAGMLAMSIGLVACGSKSGNKVTQVIAKVNDKEISVHQLNFVLKDVPAQASQEQLQKIRKAGLDRLVEQETLVQASLDQKRDQDPAVLQQLEAARREILARAHLQAIGAGAKAPDAAAISKFYQDNPALFKERNIYQFTEVNLPGVPSPTGPRSRRHSSLPTP